MDSFIDKNNEEEEKNLSVLVVIIFGSVFIKKITKLILKKSKLNRN